MTKCKHCESEDTEHLETTDNLYSGFIHSRYKCNECDRTFVVIT